MSPTIGIYMVGVRAKDHGAHTRNCHPRLTLPLPACNSLHASACLHRASLGHVSTVPWIRYLVLVIVRRSARVRAGGRDTRHLPHPCHRSYESCHNLRPVFRLRAHGIPHVRQPPHAERVPSSKSLRRMSSRRTKSARLPQSPPPLQENERALSLYRHETRMLRPLLA